MDESHTLAIFIGQLIMLLCVGRLFGEFFSRIGQPAIFGQLLAGVILGPSLFGALLPDLHAMVFPATDKLKTMIDAISQVGILLLLLLTGMETNLQLVTRKFHVVMMTSATGIAIPFAFGLALGLLLPASLVPDPSRQYITALFIGTALSISSVKIVAIVLMEVGFIRRDLGQLILATAILDDSIAWIIVAVIAGMAAKGTIDLGQVAFSVTGAVLFLAASLMFGRRLVAQLIRWCNDNLTIEFPVITAVLVVTLSLALLTDLLGVHSALGAFVAGVLIGQSPILKGHIEQELRGLIIAFFSPVFFAVAGLGIDLTTLLSPSMLLLALGFVAIATLGKTLGALVGGRLAGLTLNESFALATGLNARGSTEVIIATIGLSMGVLNTELYTLIVAMAVITTMMMPPTLRWALARVAMRPDERQRLENADAAADDHLTAIERVLVTSDTSANAALSLRLAGAFAAGQGVLTTVLANDAANDAANVGDKPFAPAKIANAAVAEIDARRNELAAARNAGDADDTAAAEGDTKTRVAVEDLIRVKSVEDHEAAGQEVTKGYNFVFAGFESTFDRDGKHFNAALDHVLSAANVPLAAVLNAKRAGGASALPQRILVPTNGTANATLAAEIAVALAKACGSQITALHVIDPAEESEMLRGRWSDPFSSVLDRVRQHGERHAVDVKTAAVINPEPNRVIRRMAASRSYDLIVVGAELRQDGVKFVGPNTRNLLRKSRTPILLVVK